MSQSPGRDLDPLLVRRNRLLNYVRPGHGFIQLPGQFRALVVGAGNILRLPECTDSSLCILQSRFVMLRLLGEKLVGAGRLVDRGVLLQIEVAKAF
jgi:hypothetical protein